MGQKFQISFHYVLLSILLRKQNKLFITKISMLQQLLLLLMYDVKDNNSNKRVKIKIAH